MLFQKAKKLQSISGQGSLTSASKDIETRKAEDVRLYAAVGHPLIYRHKEPDGTIKVVYTSAVTDITYYEGMRLRIKTTNSQFKFNMLSSTSKCLTV